MFELVSQVSSMTGARTIHAENAATYATWSGLRGLGVSIWVRSRHRSYLDLLFHRTT